MVDNAAEGSLMKLSYNVAKNLLEEVTKKIGDGIPDRSRYLKAFLPPPMLIMSKRREMKIGKRTWQK